MYFFGIFVCLFVFLIDNDKAKYLKIAGKNGKLLIGRVAGNYNYWLNAVQIEFFQHYWKIGCFLLNFALNSSNHYTVVKYSHSQLKLMVRLCSKMPGGKWDSFSSSVTF